MTPASSTDERTTTPPSFEEVESALAQDVRMFINSHAGDVKVVDISDEGDVTVEFSGACGKCPALSACPINSFKRYPLWYSKKAAISAFPS